jgi:transposase
MSELPDRVRAAISVLMDVKQRWEPGPGIRIIDAEFCGERWIVKAKASGDARCPGCGLHATRRHNFYTRRLQKMPVQGTIVELQVNMTRWRCCNQLCDRRTLAGLSTLTDIFSANSNASCSCTRRRSLSTFRSNTSFT